MDDQLPVHQTKHQDYTDQLMKLNLNDNCNRYIITYKIDQHHINLFKLLNTKQCLLSIFYIWLFSYSLLISIVNSQTLNGPNQSQNPSHNQSPRTVATKYGILRGTIITLPNLNLQQVEAFLGIPYAQPPTVTSAHWPGIKDADRIAPACPQPMPPQQLSTFKNSEFINQTSEDCLYLNIYSPISVHQHAVRLPVMVYIHGGDFESGSGSGYDGSVLASYGNVIVVTLNYRLGLLGFFPTRDGTARGNYGLMDQVAALHWLQENIVEFGGLPSNVTVFGSGSGAACIQLLMISPMARGLFQRAILQSGSAISPVYSASTLNTLRNAKQIAAQLQCFQTSSESRQSSANQFNKEKDTFKDNYSKDKQNIEKLNNKEHKSSELLECLRKQKLEKLMDLQVRQPQFLFKYSPTLEGLLLPIDPIKVMSDKQSTFLQYDLMIGVNSAPFNEFYNIASSKSSLTNEPLLADANNGDKSNSIPSFITEERKEKIIRTLVRNLYTYHLQEIYMTLSNEYHSYTNTSTDEENKLVELLNDALLIAPTIQTALLHSRSQSKSTFVYNYAALNQLDTNDYYQQQHKTIAQTKISKDQLKNQTTINEELSMIFGQPLVPSMKLIQRSNKRNYSNLEVKLSEKLMHYWTHFAKTGDPNIQQQMNSVHYHNYHSQSTLNNNNMNNNLNNLINNNNNLKDTNYSSLNEHLQKTRTEHWPNFNEYTQLYLNLNLHPTVHDHMRSHQISFFSKLIPKLNRPIANNMQMNEHHLLEDHHNLATYEGIVREHPAAGLIRNIALDLEDQLASKRMLELLLNGEKQLSEQSNDEKSKLNNLMKLREKLLKWKFISEQSNMETQQNFDDLIRKLTSRIEGGSNTNLLTRNNSSIIIEMDNTQDNGQELINNNLNQININQQDQLNSQQQETANEQQKNSDDEQDDNSIQQNLKQINSPSTNSQQPKLNDELNYQLHHNANESYSMIIQDGQYSTVISVAIIVGCSLLFLNILVFVGMFLNNFRNRRTNRINNQSANNSLLNSINNDNILNNSGLLVNNQSTNTLNGQQLKAYQANQSSIYLPCCEYDTNQQQCNATILTLKRNNSNKTYIAKTSTTCGQLKNSIENDYYLQQQQANYLDEHHLNLNNMNHNSINQNNSNSIYNTINKINDLNNTQTTFDQTNDTIILDKQNSTKLQQQQQIDYLTVDGSLGLSSGIGSLSETGVSQTLSQNISNSINSTNNTLNQMTNINDLTNEHHRHHLFNAQQQQQLNNNNGDLVNVSCSSAVSSSSAATLITSSPANTSSTPDYYQQQKNSTNLHHSTLLNNQLNSQFNNQTNYLQDQIQGLYGHQTNQYVQLTNLNNNSNYQDNKLNEIDQQSKLLNTNHCNILNCSIAQCDCTSTIYKDAYSNSHLDKMMESSN